MPILTKDYQAVVVCGLGTYTFTVITANHYFVSAQCLENPPSSVILTISQAGSATISVSTPAPSEFQEAIDLQRIFNCQIGDTLTVAITSAAPIDNQLNTVKTTINIRQGLV